MKSLAFLFAAASLSWASPLLAGAPAVPPVPHFGAVVPLPDAANQPDPALQYRVVFDIDAAAGDNNAPHPSFVKVARLLNLLATRGVRPRDGDVVAIVHGPAMAAIMTQEAHKARFGIGNPNETLIAELEAAGAQVHVCGQALHARKIAASEVVPQVKVDLAAVTTLATLQLRGFALITD